MGSFFSQAGTLLVETIFGIFVLIVLLRLMLQLAQADFYNPFSQFIVRLTNPLVLPLRRILPRVAGVDLATMLLLVALQMVKLFLIAGIHGFAAAPLAVFVLAVAQLLELALWVLIIAIFIRVILSWFSPYSQHPVMDLLYSLTEPLMRPARRVIPPISGVDLSPIAVLLALQLLLLLIANLLPALTAAVG